MDKFTLKTQTKEHKYVILKNGKKFAKIKFRKNTTVLYEQTYMSYLLTTLNRLLIYRQY